MDLDALAGALERLRIADIRALAAELHATHATAADEIEVTCAVLHVERIIRLEHRRAEAARAALLAAGAVQDAARRDRVRLPDDDVTYVARAAAVLARALVAGEAAAPDVQCLARGFGRASVRSGV